MGVLGPGGVGSGPVLLPEKKKKVIEKWKCRHFNAILYNKTVFHELTIEILNAFNVIFMQGEVLHVAVHGVHESLSDVGVIQAKGMAKLVGCHQEQTVTWNTCMEY